MSWQNAILKLAIIYCLQKPVKLCKKFVSNILRTNIKRASEWSLSRSTQNYYLMVGDNFSTILRNYCPICQSQYIIKSGFSFQGVTQYRGQRASHDIVEWDTQDENVMIISCLNFWLMQDNVILGVLSHFISIHYILFCIGFARGRNHEPYAGEFKTFRLDLQQQMVRRHFNHPFPQQKRSLRRENPQIGTHHLFPRIFR